MALVALSGLNVNGLPGRLYVPTVLGLANVAAFTVASPFFQRRGNLVSVWALGDITPIAPATQTIVSLSLPIPVNLTAQAQCVGHITGQSASGLMVGETTADVAIGVFICGAAVLDTFAMSFTYRIP